MAAPKYPSDKNILPNLINKIKRFEILPVLKILSKSTNHGNPDT